MQKRYNHKQALSQYRIAMKHISGLFLIKFSSKAYPCYHFSSYFKEKARKQKQRA